MSAVSFEREGSGALLRLDRGVINPINLALVRELAGALGSAREDPSVRSVVLTGAGDKFFSLGFDIPELLELGEEELEVFYREYNDACLELYTLPKPTAAAITGHAVAGGCILALCCDLRILAGGRRSMGLNEVKLGVPVPYLADCITRSLLGARQAREVLEGGEFYPPEELLRMGMVDEVLPVEEVRPQAVRKVGELGAFPAEAFALIKQNRVAGIADHFRARREEKQDQFLKCWHSPGTQRLLAEAREKF